MYNRLNDNLKGATLIETIVSMTLIGLIMTIALTGLYKINRESGIMLKPLAYFMVKRNINSEKKEINNAELRYDDLSFTIIKSLEKYYNSDDLLLFEVKAIDMEGKTIISARRIVSAHEIYETDEFNNTLYDK